MHRIRTLLTIAMVLCLLFTVANPIEADAQASQQERGPLPEQSHPYARGARALAQLGHRLPAVAKAYGLHSGQLRAMFTHDETLFVDGDGDLLYLDHLAPSYATANGPELATNLATVGNPFQLASNPGASKTIFLDFDGHATQDTTWNTKNQIDTIVSPAYDTDGNPGSWSVAELEVIAASWAVVAEDFAPWDVNVTTIDPGPEALRRSGPGDTRWGVRAVVTTDTVLQCGCGGVAYIGSFDDVADEPAFIFNTNFRGVSEALTHEVGHTLGLAHDGALDTNYYRGHAGADAPGWAPIMGSSYWQPVTHWSTQDFTGGANGGIDANFGQGSDDISIISSRTNGNGFGLKLDDHGDTPFAATIIDEGTNVSTGVIGTRQDRDTFSFTTKGGDTNITATPAVLGPNLDIALTLRDSDGVTIAIDNAATSLAAAISMPLPAGTYTVEIDGTGAGEPMAAVPTGYSDYSSIGQYRVEVTTLAQATTTVMGDVNCDGRTSVADALFVSQFAVGNRVAATQCPLADPTNEIYLPAADVSGNGRISVTDALLISQCTVGIANDLCPTSDA